MKLRPGDKIIFKLKESHSGFVVTVRLTQDRYVCAFDKSSEESFWKFSDLASLSEPEYVLEADDIASYFKENNLDLNQYLFYMIGFGDKDLTSVILSLDEVVDGLKQSL